MTVHEIRIDKSKTLLQEPARQARESARTRWPRRTWTWCIR